MTSLPTRVPDRSSNLAEMLFLQLDGIYGNLSRIREVA
jgi:hypothetical protein